MVKGKGPHFPDPLDRPADLDQLRRPDVREALGYVFEALTLIQTHKEARFPVILMGVDYWSGLIDWLRTHMLGAGNISPKDLDLFTLTDDPAEAVARIVQFCQAEGVAPNF